ncbi:MAG: 50S ribosomal protein L13 [bacterium]
MQTYVTKKESIKRKWYLVDAKGCVLGRLATFLANVLRGKNKAIFSPSVDCGDYIVVINAEKVVLTGKKLKQKFNWRYSGYPGGLKLTRYDELMQKNPEKAVRLAVKGMLPNNRLRDKIIKKLKIYRGAEYKEQAQAPQPLNPPKNIKIA